MQQIRDEIVELAQQLMRFRTTADRTEELQTCAAFIASYFDDTPVHIHEVERENKPSLVASLHEEKNPEVMLNGHFDVVSAPDNLFNPWIEDGKLYGRGSADMKTGVATFMVLLKQCAEMEDAPSLAAMFVPDEESSNRFSTKHLLEEEGYEPSFVIVGEPNHAAPEDMEICVRQKGIRKLRVEADGVAAHSSRPWKGRNAITELVNACQAVTDAFTHEDLEEGERWQTTVTPVHIRGGDAMNKVPAGAELILDIRYTDAASADTVVNQIKELEDVSVRVVRDAAPVETDPENRYIQDLRDAATASYRDVELSKTHGSSDLCFLMPHGIPGVECGPTGRNLHSDNEHVYLDSILPYYEALERFVQSVAT